MLSVTAKLPVPVDGFGVIVNEEPPINDGRSSILILKVPANVKSVDEVSVSVRILVNTDDVDTRSDGVSVSVRVTTLRFDVDTRSDNDNVSVRVTDAVFAAVRASDGVSVSVSVVMN